MKALLGTHLGILALAPVFLSGLIQRAKAIWAGRKGPKLHQLYFDLGRLLRKTPVYSETASWIFPFAPWLVLSSAIVTGLIAPILPGYAPFSFSNDFVYFAYLSGLGRAFLILGALDTGSSFEGMGASREATISALIEPGFFFAMGTLVAITGQSSFQDLVALGHSAFWIQVLLVGFFFILLQIEAARVPVDDPATHLELTMIHEVMILDHSGPELAAIQAASAIKLTTLSGVIAALLNPISAHASPGSSSLTSILLLAAVAIAVGMVESLFARIRMRAVPRYALGGALLSALSLALWMIAGRHIE